MRIDEARINVLAYKFRFGCHGVEGIGRSDIPHVQNDAIFNHHGIGCAEGSIALIYFFCQIHGSIWLILSV
jgi:hypothetical protein